MGRKEANIDYRDLKKRLDKNSEDIVGLKKQIVTIDSKIDSIQAISLAQPGL